MSAMQQKERHKEGGTAENVAVYPQFMPTLVCLNVAYFVAPGLICTRHSHLEVCFHDPCFSTG